MQHLIVKRILKGSMLTFLFSGLMACKESDGFSSAKGGIEGFTHARVQPVVLIPLTEEAAQGIQDRLEALASLEENIELKDERIQQLEDELAERVSALDAKILENQTKLLAIQSQNGDITPNDVRKMNQERAELKAQVDQFTEEYLENVENYKAEFETMIASFSELVTELSKYESTEELESFRTLILEKLKVLEADRDLVLARISEKESSISELQSRIADLEGDTSPEAISELNGLKEDLVEEQSSLAEDAAIAGALNGLLESSNEVLAPVTPVMPTGAALDQPSTPVAGDVPVISNQLTPAAQAMEINQQIKDLKAANESLNAILASLNAEIKQKDDAIALNNTTQLQVQKSGLLTEKSETLEAITMNEAKIAPLKVALTRLQRMIVGM